MPIDLRLEVGRYKQAARTRDHPVESQIARAADTIWRRMRRVGSTRFRPQRNREKVQTQAQDRIQEMREWIEHERTRKALARGPRPARRRLATAPTTLTDSLLLAKWGKLTWQRRWEAALQKLPSRHRATAWLTPWEQEPRMLYAGLSKAEATALFLMRTEVIGLNAWLAAARVPDMQPACPCGWIAQTVRPVLLHCPRHDRVGLLLSCGTERLEEILGRPDCAKHAARWWLRSGVMEQFRVAIEIEEEDIANFRAFEEEERW